MYYYPGYCLIRTISSLGVLDNVEYDFYHHVVKQCHVTSDCSYAYWSVLAAKRYIITRFPPLLPFDVNHRSMTRPSTDELETRVHARLLEY